MITQKQISKLTDGAQIEDNGLRARRRDGVVTFDFRFRLGGVRKQVTLGRGLTLEQAITKANMLRGQTSLGTDVAQQKKQDTERAANTLDSVLDKWLAARGDQYRSIANIRSALNLHVRPAFGATSIYDLDQHELARHFIELAKHKPETTRHARKYLTWALEWWRPQDRSFSSKFANVSVIIPTAKILPKSQSRDRVLSNDEIRDVWNAAPAVSAHYGALVRLLLLTGCRRDEIAELQAPDLKHDDYHGHHLQISAARMKGKRAHAVPLLPLVRELTGALLERRVTAFSDSKRRLDAAIAATRAAEGREPMPAWVLHDLRRTARTRWGQLRVDWDVAEAMLAHVRPGVGGIYDQYDRWAERCEATARWAKHLEQIVNGTSGGNVVALPALAS